MDTQSEENAQYKGSGAKNRIKKSNNTPNGSTEPLSLLEHRDENLSTLHKIHAILLNCINLSEKQKLEFAASQRYFMKLYLKKLREKLTIERKEILGEQKN
ncbi:MAG: hypothetical protein ACFFA3_10650 [Promethearchaeota archaeon]